jgi:hypothetical protein
MRKKEHSIDQGNVKVETKKVKNGGAIMEISLEIPMNKGKIKVSGKSKN